MTPIRMSALGAAMLAGWEGIVPAPYLCSQGKPTVGIGHTAAAGDPDPKKIDPRYPDDADLQAAIDVCVKLFVHVDLPKYEAAVQKVHAARLRIVGGSGSQAAFDALVHFHYNTGAVPSSTAAARYESGLSRDQVGEALMWWTKNSELVKRRSSEDRLLRHGVYDERNTAIWRTNGKMKLAGVKSTIKHADMVAMFRSHGLV